MNIAVDLDGVIWDIQRIFLEIYNEDYNENETFENVTKWFHFPQERFEPTYAKTIERLFDYPILDKDIPIYLFFLIMNNHNVKILTQNQNSIERLKQKLWDLKIYEGVNYSEIIRLERTDSKLNYEFDIYVDDNPRMIDGMRDYPDRVLLLYEEPWNKSWNVSNYPNVIRVKDWVEVIDKIGEIEYERTNRI